MTDEDAILVSQFRDERTRSLALHSIIKKYERKVYWHVRKIVIDHDDSDDVLQNTFIKVWENLANFREDSKLYTWIYRIATNEALAFLKKKRTKFFLPIVDVESELSSKIDDSSQFTGTEIERKLQKALLKLPEKQRIVFNMKYFDDMKYEDISEVLGTSVGALKASYHHAVKKIEKYLEAI
ncbi:MAG TPA: RNA polymerase sigma factor [Bacteroidia bacterium]|nr:RNA polymerase sigma factor [Bacteroidia bacterium]